MHISPHLVRWPIISTIPCSVSRMMCVGSLLDRGCTYLTARMQAKRSDRPPAGQIWAALGSSGQLDVAACQGRGDKETSMVQGDKI